MRVWPMLEVRQTSTVIFLATITSARLGSDLTLMAWPTRLVFSFLTAQARFSTEPNLSADWSTAGQRVRSC